MQGPEWPKSTTQSYDPQGSGMDNDLPEAPGVENSGNLKYKHDVPGDHAQAVEAPTGLRGD